MRIVAAILMLGAASFTSPVIAQDSACNILSRQVETASPGPLFLPSFPTAPVGPLQNTAFLYDNAVAAIALVGCGDAKDAARIGDAIFFALNHDRFWHDGRLRNAYAAGLVEQPVKLAGWWDKKQNHWVEDGYQVGSDTGNMAWAMLALIALDRVGQGARYGDGALRIGRWAEKMFDTRPPPGFMGGTFGDQPRPQTNRWKSTEHNTDLAAAFAQLAAITNDAQWKTQSDRASGFVATVWNAHCHCFDAGMAENSKTRNTTLALDAQLWPLMAIPGAASRYASVLATVQHRIATGNGMAYGDAKGGVWTEGTEQAALAMTLMGRAKQARMLAAAAEANRAPDGSYFASNSKTATGFDLQTDLKQHRAYFRIPALAPLAWAALAEQHFNPFTGTKALPR